MPSFDRYKTACSVAFALAVAFFAFFAFKTGLCLGGASYRLEYSYASESRRGTSLGCKSFYLRKGQTFYTTYDLDIKEGSLRFHLINRSAPFMKGTVGFETVRASGKGTFAVPIRESGWYVLVIAGQSEGRSRTYELEYTANWHAQ